jgi:hypothetical protein
MNLNEIKKVARGFDIITGKMKKTELIRSIQSSEGNIPCFETVTKDSCSQMNCLWRNDC